MTNASRTIETLIRRQQLAVDGNTSKAWVLDVWACYVDETGSHITLDTFKAWLPTSGLTLGRCDMAHLYNRALVEASEVSVEDGMGGCAGTFHFVRV